MPINITSTKDAMKLQGLKVLVYGDPGTGKTTLISTAPGKPIILSAESGLLSLRHTDIPVITINALADMYEAYEYLVGSEDGQQYDWVCLDSITDEMKQTNDPRKAYGALIEKMGDMLRAFRDMPGRNVYFSCKMERNKDDHTGSIFYGPMMPGTKLSQHVPYMFDEVLCLRAEKNDEGNLVRALQTQPDNIYIAKDRSGVLEPYEAADLSVIFNKITGDTTHG